MISEYKKRKLRQKFLCDKSLLCKKTDLISEGKIPINLLSNIQSASMRFIYSTIINQNKSKNLNIEQNLQDLIKYLEKNKPDNITHNGMIVPRKEISLEYNLFLKSFIDFLKYSGIFKLVDYFVSPPQLRIKFNDKNTNPNASNNIHSDAWTNHNTDKSCTLYLPIFGDVKKNYVKFFKPKENYIDINWLKFRKFDSGEDVVKNYKPVDVKYEIGKFLVSDCSTLHQSILLKNAKPRLSMDIAFIPKISFYKSKIKSHVKASKLDLIGTEEIMIFKDSINLPLKQILKKKRQSLSNRKIIKL